MPGQLGNVQRTIQNLIIVKIMPEENIMLVKGSVPGHKGSIVIIKPTKKKYTPKEIYTEKVVSEATSESDNDSLGEEQITDKVEKEEINSKDNKEV
jgi:large subunit ribosomal protein L3